MDPADRIDHEALLAIVAAEHGRYWRGVAVDLGHDQRVADDVDREHYLDGAGDA